MSEPACINCQKAQSDLDTSLKVCARCHTQQYCSRECQKAHWAIHKKQCGKTSTAFEAPPTTTTTTTSGALSDSRKQEILTYSSQIIDLMRLLAKCEGYHHDSEKMTAADVTGLKGIADFVQRTFRDYWSHLIPQRIVTNFMVEAAPFFGVDEESERKRLDASLVQVLKQNPGLDLDKWPEPVDVEKYSDGVQRNIMAAEIILDPRKQSLMGGVYDYSAAVKELCRQMQQKQ